MNAIIRIQITALLLVAMTLSHPDNAYAEAQQVPLPEEPSTAPELHWEGTGIATLKLHSQSGVDPKGAVDFGDSAILFGASQALYNGNGIGSFVFGSLLNEESNLGTGSPFFVHEGFVEYQSKSFETHVGRSDNPMAQIVTFPTIRGDDLVTVTNFLDPFSNGRNVDEHRYSNIATAVFNQNLTTFENIHVQHLIDSQSGNSEANINSFGASFQYIAPPGREALQRVATLGFGFEHVMLNTAYANGLHSVYAGSLINLNESITDRVDFRLFDTLTFGSSLSSFQSLNDTFRANNNAIAAAVRYLNSPFGVPGYQLSLTGGLRTYSSVGNANSLGLALTGVKRLGEGFDLVAQYSYEWRDSSLAAQYAGAAIEHTIEVGLVFNFMATLNKHLSPRRTLINYQHQYIPN